MLFSPPGTFSQSSADCAFTIQKVWAELLSVAEWDESAWILRLVQPLNSQKSSDVLNIVILFFKNSFNLFTFRYSEG